MPFPYLFSIFFLAATSGLANPHHEISAVDECDRLLELVEEARSSANEKNGSEIFWVFARVFEDQKKYETTYGKIHYEAVYNSKKNIISGLATKDRITMTFRLSGNGSIEGNNYFDMACDDERERYHTVVNSLSTIVLNGICKGNS
jgi:hypothetical protein